MQHSRQNALSPDELNKLMDTVVFFDMDELVRVTNQAIERGKSALTPADAEACLYAQRFIAAVPRSGPPQKFPLPTQLLEDSDEE